MRIRIIAALLLSTLFAGLPRAQAGTAPPALTLAWQTCAEGAARTTTNFGCTVNSSEFYLFPSFQLAAPVDSVVGIEGVIDLTSQTGALPSWWELQPGGCRQDGLIADVGFTNDCTDPWAGNGAAAIQAYRVSPDVPTPDRARIVFTAEVIPSQKVTLAANVPYYSARIILRTSKTAGGTICAGCATNVCLVLNSIRLLRLPGTTGPDTIVQDSGATANWAYWQGTSGLDCASVPVRNRTWGAIKSLYR